IARSYKTYQYVFDPHTAVAMKVYEDYRYETNDQTFSVIASTASPFKFSSNVIKGLAKERQESCRDEWQALDRLNQLTGWKVPQGLQGLENKAEKSVSSIKPEDISEFIQKKFA
ncbi:MAG: threonine synthase, partial [Desulfosporosinus sp.]|nr:threonine synthase [Desulfosporosinus sp.]